MHNIVPSQTTCGCRRNARIPAFTAGHEYSGYSCPVLRSTIQLGVAVAVAMLVSGPASDASADPVPKVFPRKPLNIALTVPLKGPGAPQTAREWFEALAPNFSWRDENTPKGTKTLTSTRNFHEIGLKRHDVILTSVTTRVFRGKNTLIAMFVQGICCCGGCDASVYLFQVRGEKLVEVTQSLWPKGIEGTNNLALTRLEIDLPKKGSIVRVTSPMWITSGKVPTNRRVLLAKLKWSHRTNQFQILWLRPDD